jgi:hypothetical protein
MEIGEEKSYGGDIVLLTVAGNHGFGVWNRDEKQSSMKGKEVQISNTLYCFEICRKKEKLKVLEQKGRI